NLSYEHNSMNGLGGFPYSFTATMAQARNAIVDSMTIDVSGIRSVYKVNLDGYRFMNIRGSVNKAFKAGANRIQFTLNGSAFVMRTPGFINARQIIANNTNITGELQSSWALKSFLTLRADNELRIYSSSQKGTNESFFRSTEFINRIVAGAQLTRKLFVKNIFSFTNLRSQNLPSSNFVLWHMFAGYRFLKADNLELQFSALDIFRKNRGVINSGDSRTITIGRTNVLQQYFTIGVSYFPRKFGKGD
ncbi:MAG: hypothetical protein ABW174_05930, partial [Flavitalea sp.]